MDRSFVAGNEAELAHIRSVLSQLSDDDMSRPVGEHWTAGVALMHLAFWDRLWLSKFEEWERTRNIAFPPLRELTGPLNDAMLLWWRSIEPIQIRHEVIAAAEAIDAKVAALPDAVLEAIVAVRPRTLLRATHRREHLEDIRAALAG